MRGPEGASFKERCRSSKTEDESQAAQQSPDRTSAKYKYDWDYSPVV